MDGIVVVDKPAGMTSHQVIARIRHALKAKGVGRSRRRHGPRVGHAGTLDPAATGVLVVCLGSATRLVPYLQASAKTYDARLRLGVTTDTLDADGTVRSRTDASSIDERTFCEALRSFAGPIEQVPPMVSAVKVGGERLYARARRGEEVERPPRTVTIQDLVLEEFVPGPSAEAAFLVTCSPGTYIRALAADVGDRLGVGAHLVSLRRLASGRFTVDTACSLDDVVRAIERDVLTDLVVAPADAVADYPAVRLDTATETALGHGRSIPATGIAGPVAALGTDGRLLAMVEDRGGNARPLVVFPPGQAGERRAAGGGADGDGRGDGAA